MGYPPAGDNNEAFQDFQGPSQQMEPMGYPPNGSADGPAPPGAGIPIVPILTLIAVAVGAYVLYSFFAPKEVNVNVQLVDVENQPVLDSGVTLRVLTIAVLLKAGALIFTV